MLAVIGVDGEWWRRMGRWMGSIFGAHDIFGVMQMQEGWGLYYSGCTCTAVFAGDGGSARGAWGSRHDRQSG